MIKNYALELQKIYMPFVIIDKNENITGFVENAPIKAKKAAKEHIIMSMKFDDVFNAEYWENMIIQLGLVDVDVSKSVLS
jgi:hypothetical protein